MKNEQKLKPLEKMLKSELIEAYEKVKNELLDCRIELSTAEANLDSVKADVKTLNWEVQRTQEQNSNIKKQRDIANTTLSTCRIKVEELENVAATARQGVKQYSQQGRPEGIIQGSQKEPDYKAMYHELKGVIYSAASTADHFSRGS